MSTAGLTLDPVRINRLRRRAIELTRAGWTTREIACEFGCSMRTVERYKSTMRQAAR